MLLEVERKIKSMPILTKQNLSILLDKKKDAVDYWVKKMLKSGVLIKLKNGVYASRYYVDLVSQNPEDKTKYLEYLANVLRSPSYVSLEYVLSKGNVTAEAVFKITSVTTKTARVYQTELGTFSYRQIKQELFNGYQNILWRDKQIKEASLEKALADLQYLNKGADTSRYNNVNR
ncbi:MAG: hypothetical protein Q7S57_03990 [bacterium]|nr:hypothetical protein [bacterium]